MKQISLIGLSKAGKTCYTYAMAHVMGHHHNGISIFTDDNDLQEELFEGWEQIFEDGIWPPSTDMTTNFKFNCLLYNRPVFEFWWRDFRGGTLSGRDEDSKEGRRDFSEYIKDSDGIIFFMAADMVLGIKNQQEGWNKDYRHLGKFVNYVTQQKEKVRDIPFVVAITKSDLLDEDAKSSILDFVKHMLPPLFESGYGAKTLVTFVSLGRNLVGGKHGCGVGGAIFSDPAKGNIHLPILFNLYTYLIEKIDTAREELDGMEGELADTRKALRRYSERSEIYKFFNSDTNLINSKEELESTIEQLEKQIEQAEVDLEQVRQQFVRDCYYYVDGELQQI